MSKFEVGHGKIPGAGRPKNAKNKDTEFRASLMRMYLAHMPDIEERLYAELMGLKGYAFISGWNIIAKKLMPDLQSTTLEASFGSDEEGGVSPLIAKINSLKITKIVK